jgi:hypothetical protein
MQLERVAMEHLGFKPPGKKLPSTFFEDTAVLLLALAKLIDPAHPQYHYPLPQAFEIERTIRFHRRRSHSNVFSDYQITEEVEDGIKSGMPKLHAYKAVGKRHLMTAGHVGRVYRRFIAAGLRHRRKP